MRNLLKLVLVSLGLNALATSVVAQDFPVRPIVIVAPAPPPGTVDFFGRLFAEELQKRWNNPVVVENRAGAGGMVGTEYVARAQPDGYTLLMGNDSLLTFNLFVKTSLKAEDLVPVTLVASLNPVMVTSQKVPAKTVGEFIAYAKSNPGRLNGGYLPNTSQYLDMLRFAKQTGIQIQLIPYGAGYGPIARALLADEVQFVIGSPPPFSAQIQAGKLNAIAIAGSERTPSMPTVPTIRESGVDFERTLWNAFFAPAGTPRPIIAKLSGALSEIARMPEIAAKIRSQGTEPRAIGYEEGSKILASQIRITTEGAREANIRPQ